MRKYVASDRLISRSEILRFQPGCISQVIRVVVFRDVEDETFHHGTVL